MKNRCAMLILVLAVLAAASSTAFAQQPDEKSDGPKALDTSLKISGLIFAEYAQLYGYQPGKAWNQRPQGDATDRAVSENQNSTFRLTRAYLNFRKNLTESLSLRVTTDVEGSTTTAMMLYLKFAYAQYQERLFGFMTVNFQFGLIATPVTGVMDDLSDCRWIYNDLLDKSGNILRGFGVDSTADFGVRLGLDFAGLVSLTGGWVNGEGFKKADETGNFDGKAYYASLSIHPLESLYLNGFFRYENDAADNTAASSGVSAEMYYGFGVAWKSAPLNAGVHCFYLINDDRSDISRKRTRYGLVEAYFLASIGEFLSWLPLLVHGRFGYGIEWASDIANGGEDYTTIMAAAGLGWKFNDHLRVMAYYETYRYSMTGTLAGYHLPDDANNFMLKCEVKF